MIGIFKSRKFWLVGFGLMALSFEPWVLETKAEDEKKIETNQSEQSDFTTTAYLYEQCKEAIKAAKDKPEDFIKTFCAAHIEGFLSGSLATGLTVPTIQKTEDTCVHEKNEIIKSIQNRFCFPEDYPLVKMADDFTLWIESEPSQMGQKDFLKIPSFHGLAEAFVAVYSCRSQKIRNEQEGDRNGMDN